MRIVSWNVNSIRVRLENFSELVRKYAPDVVLLQETRIEDEKFPREYIEDWGYNLAAYGQKARNGVAICSKFLLEEVNFDFAEEARYIEAFTGGIFVASVYVPNGQEVGCPNYFQKLEFLSNFREYLKKFDNDLFVLGGDFNVGPYPRDIYIPNYDGIAGSAPERAEIEKLRETGFIDLLKDKGFTWWSYRQRDFKRNNGFRLDHFYVKQKTHELVTNSQVLTDIRELERPSDHAPIMCDIKI